ncbi:octaprenyl-diphosphate synthase [Ereboglobus sp. PH5-5]|uniref:polyprenyl synthetase family protein n=1 Tax=Ereboglobus sp. PH5-5 TaxID=2940529 RepID=UPI0024070962|nr:polyprenyl synthetase family protein [Ereboglobus sp. PH5-5]MDF9833093.1 octaprenyl-diphosphate synthase [Ereboglobus sp. PH5-5]
MPAASNNIPGNTANDAPARSVARDFATVFALLKPQMARLDAFLREQMTGFEPEIRPMAEYCIDTSGKRIRPALVFLGGWTGAAENAPQELIRAAAVVELVHLATLVHDDIMDGAELRRNRRTAAREYGAEAAVLLGDALLAHAVHIAAQFPTTEVCAEVSNATRRVCAGEIIQTMRRGTLEITLEDYQRIIDLKTAELFRVSCYLGGRLAGHPLPYCLAAAEFGRRLGVAYQIYDDLADFFGDEKRIGKTLGTDLASGKITLPLIELFNRLPSDADRAALTDEILRRAVPRPDLRIQQMNTLGVFEAVSDAIHAELRAAEAVLAPHATLPPAPLLLRLRGVLHDQVLTLKKGE